jgi:hypothetical protein
MRELTVTELDFVAGGHQQCSSESGGNTYGGISDTSSLGREIIEIYEGLVQATSYIMERIADAFR